MGAVLSTTAALESTRERKKSSEAVAIKLLPSLIEALRWGQTQRVSETCVSVASAIEEYHPAVAKKLRQLAGNEGGSGVVTANLATKVAGLAHFEMAGHGLDDVVLPTGVESECHDILDEHRRREELAAFGLAPRHRVLLHGAPGNGKTLLAEALAHELGVPFLRARYGNLVASYMGQTGANLDLLFQYAATAPCLLFLDEFDGIGMDRNSKGDVGEARRITNQLLISLERLPSTCMFVAATNAPGLLDVALRRRFDFEIDIPAPSVDLQLRCARGELAAELTPGYVVTHLAEQVASLGLTNLYEVVELCKRIRRDLVLQGGIGIHNLLRKEAKLPEIIDHNGVPLIDDPFGFLETMK